MLNQFYFDLEDAVLINLNADTSLWTLEELEKKIECDFVNKFSVKAREEKDEFTNWLSNLTFEKPTYLLINDIEKISRDNGVWYLYWLPKTLPHNLKIIISTNSLDIKERAEFYDWTIYHVTWDMMKTDVTDYVNSYLKLYGKKLSQEQMAKLKALPLFCVPSFCNLILKYLITNAVLITWSRRLIIYVA